MAEGGEKRSPTSHRTPGQIKRHGRTYQASEEQKKNRAQRNNARAMLEREGAVSKGDGKDVHHKKSPMKGGKNDRSNLQAVSKSINRGHGQRYK
jgi:hypothetical protein